MKNVKNFIWPSETPCLRPLIEELQNSQKVRILGEPNIKYKTAPGTDHSSVEQKKVSVATI
jgi:hypothetical protein